MSRKVIDLSAHINQNVVKGHPADFPVELRPLFCASNGTMEEVPSRMAVVRQDTGKVLSVVSDRYRLVPHQSIMNTVEAALRTIDVGPAPRGIYVDQGGTRMRALFKFPALAQAITPGDEICPCLKVKNTYDGTSRITLHIGAFRFVCTNLAVGGGGVFAGGFMSIHAGEIPLDQAGAQLAGYLSGFASIVELYRVWNEAPVDQEALKDVLKDMPRRASLAIQTRMVRAVTVFDAYNAATHVATHQMQSVRGAFALLDRINANFQELTLQRRSSNGVG